MKNLLLSFAKTFVMYFKQKKIRRNILGVLFIFVILVLVGITLMQMQRPRGAETKQEIVQLYLTALTKQDYNTIHQLAPPDYDSKEAIQEELKNLGGNTFEEIGISFKETIKSGLWYATIQGKRIDRNNNRHPFIQTLTLKGGPKRWFLLLGKQNSDLPPMDQPPLKINPSDYPFASITRTVEKEMERTGINEQNN